jgi:hypothetical protein
MIRCTRRRALAVWNLTSDDLGVVSIHGTSTQANEKNEPLVYNDVFTNIGRTPGNAVPVIAQKNLTGVSRPISQLEDHRAAGSPGPFQVRRRSLDVG